jgi:hypothetical protein
MGFGYVALSRALVVMLNDAHKPLPPLRFLIALESISSLVAL